ncbi:MAG: DUF1127 domain-containing protein [Xanthobacteraceae bacterium]
MNKSRSLIALRIWMRFRSNRRILSQLSDRTLRDIGLSRSGIGYAAKASAAKVRCDKFGIAA